MKALTEAQWKIYGEEGYLKLGKILTDQELSELSLLRIDDIMTGKAELDYDRLMMQREAGEGYDQTEQTSGYKGSTLNYRKIENLEYDSLFLSYIQKPLFYNVCQRLYGKGRISCFRVMFMNKPAHNGSVLPYHQDRWSDLDRDPLITVWTALDRSSTENGCVKIFPKTHKQLINSEHSSGFLKQEQAEKLLERSKPVSLEMEAGEAVMLNNWTVHGSEGNTSDKSRRAFSVCYMDADTSSAAGRKFTVVFGSGALCPEEL